MSPDAWLTIGSELVAIAASHQMVLDPRSGDRIYSKLVKLNPTNGPWRVRLTQWSTRWMPTPQTLVNELGDALSETQREMLLTYQPRAFAWLAMLLGAAATWIGALLTWAEVTGYVTPLVVSLAVLAITATVGGAAWLISVFQTKHQVGRRLVQPLE